MQADTSTRLRLVEIQTPGGPLPIGGGFACVFASPAARSAAARYIATTVVGPRPAGSDGTIEIAGRFVSVHSLPSPLLAPSAPSVLGTEALRAQWRAAWDRRRSELAAVHASRRLAKHRAEAALERARARVAELPAAPPPPPPAPEPVDDGLTARIAEVRALLGGLGPEPSPEALALADAWDELCNVESHAVADPALDFARSRVQTARAAMSTVQGGLTVEERTEIDRLHRDVGEAEGAVSNARRRERTAALARYDAAVRAEQEALASIGIESYASFLVEVAQGSRGSDPTSRNRAARELAEAEGELARLEAAGEASVAEPVADELELRARAAELLGRFPGADVAGELRALRVEHPEVEELRGELAFLEREEAARLAAPPPPPPVPVAPVVEVDAAVAEYEILHSELDAHSQAVTDLEHELARLDRLRDADIVALGREDLLLALTGVLDAYRRGDLLAGRLPMVFEGALDGLAADARRAAVALLAGAQDVQAIVVSDDWELADAVNAAGGVVLQWPEPGALTPALGAYEHAPPPAPPTPPARATPVASSQPAPATAFPPPPAPPAPSAPSPLAPSVAFPPAPVMSPAAAGPPLVEAVISAPVVAPTGLNPRCVSHTGVESIAQCAQCQRACCIDCLVYVIGEPDLWCAECARRAGGPEARPSRLMRRRGV